MHRDGERGSVTIEATIALSSFMFAIVTVLTILNICIVQAKMSIAIDGAAKELSHYSYLYALTGIPGGQAKLAEAASGTRKEIDGVLSDVNTVFTEIKNLGQNDREEPRDIGGFLSAIGENAGDIQSAGGALKADLEALAEDPMGIAMGLVKIAGNDAMNLAMSRLVAAPLSKALSKKNLVAEQGGDVEAYLKFLGVKPNAAGSCLGGLDFSRSTIFPDGSNEIRVNVAYDVKVIALLPLDFSFHFNQTAVTHGWLSGEESYRTALEQLEQEGNSSIWTEGTISERSDLIRHQGIQDLLDEGYVQVAGRSFQDLHVYNSETNEFVVIRSMNPLYSNPGEDTLTLADISETAIREQVEYLCTGISDSANALTAIETRKKGNDGSTERAEYSCENNTQKLILVIPEDEGLKDKIQSIIDACDTRGVTVELIASYGKGARTSVKAADEGGDGE